MCKSAHLHQRGTFLACVHLFKAAAARMEEGRALYLEHVGVNTEYPRLLSKDLTGEKFGSGVTRAEGHSEDLCESDKTGNIEVFYSDLIRKKIQLHLPLVSHKTTSHLMAKILCICIYYFLMKNIFCCFDTDNLRCHLVQVHFVCGYFSSI